MIVNQEILIYRVLSGGPSGLVTCTSYDKPGVLVTYTDPGSSGMRGPGLYSSSHRGSFIFGENAIYTSAAHGSRVLNG